MLKENEDNAVGDFRPITDYDNALNSIREIWHSLIHYADYSKTAVDIHLLKFEFNRFYNHVIESHYKDYQPHYHVGRVSNNGKAFTDNEEAWYYEAYPFLNVKLELYRLLISWRNEIADLMPSNDSAAANSSNKLYPEGDYKPCVEKAKIINLYDLLIDNGIINNIGYDDFIKCFDLTKQPPIVPTVKKQKMLILALMQINAINPTIAKRNFDVNSYAKEKSIINRGKVETDEFGGTAIPLNKRLIANKIAKWLQ